MKTFKKFLEAAIPTNVDPKTMDRRKVKRRTEQQPETQQVDFNDPAFTHGYNKALKDDETWPPKPAAKYKADQIRWAVSAGKKPEHLAKES